MSEKKEIKLDILELIIQKQNKNGLKNSNYGQYRNYCSKRILKLRQCLNLTHTFGKAKYHVNFFIHK
jgi:hypothetical protein